MSTGVFLVAVGILMAALVFLEVYGWLAHGESGTISFYARHRWWLRLLILSAIVIAAVWWWLHSAA